MCEKQAQRYLPAQATGCFVLCKSGKDLRQRLIEPKLPALMKEHGHRRGGHHLGDAGQIIDSGRPYTRRFGVIREATDAIESEHPCPETKLQTPPPEKHVPRLRFPVQSRLPRTADAEGK